jgi:hypothetical protein
MNDTQILEQQLVAASWTLVAGGAVLTLGLLVGVLYYMRQKYAILYSQAYRVTRGANQEHVKVP